MYDAASFRQQHFLSNPFGGQAYAGVPPPPLSPRTGMGSMGSLPPPSPLFPRVAANSAGRLSPGGNGRAPPSPAPYLSPPLGPAVSSYGAVYQTYSYGGAYNNGGNGAGPEDDTVWSERYVNFRTHCCLVNSSSLHAIHNTEVNRTFTSKRPHSCMEQRAFKDNFPIVRTLLMRCFRLPCLTPPTIATPHTLLMEAARGLLLA
jgi:hypothetical protein